MNDRHSQKPYPLRMTDEMRASLEASAKRVGRSLHAEILARLQVSLDQSVNEAVGNAVVNAPQFVNRFMSVIDALVEKHGIEYVFPDENHEGKKRQKKT